MERCLLGGGDGFVYAMNLTSGDVIWKYATSFDVIRSSPSIANGNVFVVANDGNVYAFGKDE